MGKLLIGPFLAYAQKLRFPTLFKITAALFVFSLLLPPGLDPSPFLDEILFGLGTLLLSSWRRHKDETAVAKPPIEGEKSKP